MDAGTGGGSAPALAGTSSIVGRQRRYYRSGRLDTGRSERLDSSRAGLPPPPLGPPTISAPLIRLQRWDERRGERGADGTRTGAADRGSGRAGAITPPQLHPPEGARP